MQLGRVSRLSRSSPRQEKMERDSGLVYHSTFVTLKLPRYLAVQGVPSFEETW